MSIALTGVPHVSVRDMEKILIRRMAEYFKRINPDVAQKIDNAAAEITGKSWAKKIVGIDDPALMGSKVRTSLHLESQAGQGKTYIVNSAAKKFADLVGMNFVDLNAVPEYYLPTKNDVCLVPLSFVGEYNKSEAGGLPIRIKLGNGVSEDSLILSLKDRLEGIADMAGRAVSFVQKEQSGLDVSAMSVQFAKDDVAVRAGKSLQEWAAKRLHDSGGRLVVLNENEPPQDNSFSMRAIVEGGKLEIEYFEPKKDLREMHAMSKLPNAAWAKASMAGASIMFVDEVDKVSPAIRHLLLEIAQFGRVSGTASLGENYMVITAGNLGDRGYQNDHNDSISQSTVAETNRRETYVIMNTPEDWAEYASLKYKGSDQAHVTSFIRNHGSQPGIFTPDLDDVRFDPNKPCATARSIEAALVRAMSNFAMADASGVSRDNIYNDPDFYREILAIAGEPFTGAFVSHVKAMETQAVPLAAHIFAAKSEKLDDIETMPLRISGVSNSSFLSLLEQKTGQFSYIDPEHKAFAQRLSDAIVSHAVTGYLHAKDGVAQEDSLAKAFSGLGLLSREERNAGIALINNQIRALEANGDIKSSDYIATAGRALARAKASGFHHVPGLTKEEQKINLDSFIADASQVITGHRVSTKKAPT